jgi:mercuric ion binding protein
MIRYLAAAGLAILLSPLAAHADEKSVVLDVHNATCELCGPIVKRVLGRVSGVKDIAIKDDKPDSDAFVTVTFDDTKTNADALVAATTNVGYPTQIKK